MSKILPILYQNIIYKSIHVTYIKMHIKYYFITRIKTHKNLNTQHVRTCGSRLHDN